MTAWAAGAWAVGAWQGTAWQSSAAAVVPDVSGLSQAAAVAALEAAGFVVAVETATSTTVAAGDVISQAPAGGAEATEGSTVTITVSSGADDLLSAKYLGYPNVRRRGLQTTAPEPPEPLPAEITNMPDAPPAPKPELLARGVAADLAAVTPEPVPDVPAPDVPVPKVKGARKLALVAPSQAPSAPPVEPLAASAAPAPPVDDRMPALVTKVNSLVLKIDAQDQQIAAMEKATAAMVKALENQVNALRSTLAQEKMNRLRAEEITRRLLKDLVEED